MTVGKIYCAKLIYENYKFMRRKGQIQAKVTDESDNSRFSRDVTAAMLMNRTIAKKVFWEFDPNYFAKLDRHVAIVLYTKEGTKANTFLGQYTFAEC